MDYVLNPYLQGVSYSVLKRLFNKHKELTRNFVLYGLIGASAAVVDYAVCTGLVYLFDVNRFIANFISAHVGLAVSFPLNALYNFKVRNKLFRRFCYYYTIIFCGMILSQVILLITGFVFESVFIQKGIAIVIVSCTQFLINRSFTFSKKGLIWFEKNIS